MPSKRQASLEATQALFASTVKKPSPEKPAKTPRISLPGSTTKSLKTEKTDTSKSSDGDDGASPLKRKSIALSDTPLACPSVPAKRGRAKKEEALLKLASPTNHRQQYNGNGKELHSDDSKTKVSSNIDSESTSTSHGEQDEQAVKENKNDHHSPSISSNGETITKGKKGRPKKKTVAKEDPEEPNTKSVKKKAASESASSSDATSERRRSKRLPTADTLDSSNPQTGESLSSSTTKTPVLVYATSSHDVFTNELLETIFSMDILQFALRQFNIQEGDYPHFTLETLSTSHVFNAARHLQHCERALDMRDSREWQACTTEFHKVIPMMPQPTWMFTYEPLWEQAYIVNILHDIVNLRDHLRASETKNEGLIALALDNSEKEVRLTRVCDDLYKSAAYTLELLPTDRNEADDEFQVICRYASNTNTRKFSTFAFHEKHVLQAWRLHRKDEMDDSMELGSGEEDRRLLWHGVHVASVGQCLMRGLRLPPTVGGILGKGLCFSPELSAFTRQVGVTEKNVAYLFLCEVVLGRVKSVQEKQCHLYHAPEGYDSVVLRGRMEPDMSQAEKLSIGGHSVSVPSTSPIPNVGYEESDFSHSTYAIYRPTQCILRYLVKLRF